MKHSFDTAAVCGRRLARVASALVFGVLHATAATQAPKVVAEEKPVETTTFSIPETLLVRALFERATTQVEARRFTEAIADLQTILEKHAGELLPGERPKTPSGRASEGIVHAGASTRARAMLLALPVSAKDLYRARYEVEAGAALAVARAAHDAEALVEVGRRWPLTHSALSALLALGDLELERGEEREAAYAWTRAAALFLSDSELDVVDAQDWKALNQRVAARSDDPFTSSLLARMAWAAARSESRRKAELTRDMERSLRLPNSESTLGPLPGERADAWAEPYTIPPHPFRETSSEARDALFAVRSGERLFVSNSLRLVCLHAYTGEVLWDSNEPRGWSELSRSERTELFRGVDRSAGLVAPAVSDAVVVCALQLPFSLTKSDSYGNITILTPIPERRLFAFDVATGRRLWDHTPPIPWDGEGGSFAQRTCAAAPPVIAGSRVLVPCVRMQGRINYNVGCFDLFTGDLLWSRDVISGQREQNMFGRTQHEFCAAPLRVEGDKVIALTQLGTIAALDLFTGEILWETLHECLDIPRSRGFDSPQYKNEWRNCPPVVQNGVILAAPFNSRDLLALDLATGVTLWSQDVGTLRSLVGNSRVDVLFGASRDAVYLGGDRWLALHKPSGVGQRERGALQAKAQARDDEVLSRGGRPTLAEDRVVDPRLTERIEFERESGAKMTSTRWPEGSQGGNVLLGTGEMFVVSGNDVRGYFEWDVLVGRARAEAVKAPRDPVKILRLARLLDGRGTSEWQRGETDAARAHFAEARSILERVLDTQSNRTGGGDAGMELASVYHSILRQGALVRAGLADTNGALADLQLARAWAPDGPALRDTLVQELAIRFERQGTAGADPKAVSAALDELERSCADLPLQVGFRIPNDPASTPFGIEFFPHTSGRTDDSSALPEMPVGLWVLIQRDHKSAQGGDEAGEFDALHAILERYADVEVLTWKAGDLAKQRIEALTAAGRTRGYEVFEARAQSLYEEGVRSHDDGVLKLVTERFPGSRAALAANDARLEIALGSGDIGTVARIVRGEWKDGFDPETAGPETALRLLRLADAFGRVGNAEARSALLRGLALAAGETRSDVPNDGGATIAELAEKAPRFARAERALERGHFKTGTDSATERSFQGDFDLIGETLPSTAIHETPAGRPSTLLFARSANRSTTNLVAIDSNDPTAERWTIDIPPRTSPNNGLWSRRSGFAAGRAIVATNDKVIAIDTDAGAEIWEWRPSLIDVASISLAVRSGIAVAVVIPRPDPERWFVVGLDAKTGAELWRETGLDMTLLRWPVLSDSRVVFMPQNGSKVVLVLDLFTGARSRRIELETTVQQTTKPDSDAWIEGDRLFIPWFNQQTAAERNHVLAVDLATGRSVWRLAIGDARAPRWIAAVLQQGERTWLLLQARGTSDPMLVENSLHLLDTKIGALTPVTAVRIGMDDRILGLGSSGRVVFPEGPIALLSPRSGAGRGPVGDARVRCIDLDRGELWAAALGIPFDELAVGSLPMPAASDTILAVVTVSNPASFQGSAPRADLRAFDIATGLPRGMRGVPMTETKDVPQLFPLGELLMVRTRARMEFLK